MKRKKSNLNAIILLYLLLSVFTHLHSQSKDDIYEIYQNKDYNTLKEKLTTIKASLPKAEQLFFETLFIQDAEKAFEIYKELFEKNDGKVKYFSAERLKDYYYAKGYYSTASDYERYLVENRDLIESKTYEIAQEPAESPVDTDRFYIQVGAFTLQENALQMQEMLQTQKINSKIITREVQSKKLYCVWVPGLDEFSDTLKYANELKQKYHLDYNIIKE